MSEEYDKQYRDELIKQHITRANGILHLGAHLGQEAEKYDKLGKPVLWIEALPEIFKRLEQRISQFAGQKALNALLGDSDNKILTFHVSNNKEGVSSSLFKFGEYGTGQNSLWPALNLRMTSEIQLQSTTLDSLLAANRIDPGRYNYWVVDLQGAEKLMLEGASQSIKHCQALLIEVSTVEVYKKGVLWPELRNFLASLGFSPLWEPYHDHCDILFARNRKRDVLNIFHSGNYLKHNEKRLEHLESLGLDLENKNVLEVGAGIGDHTYFYLERGCHVTATEIRPENLRLLKRRYSDYGNKLHARRLDLDNPGRLRKQFDVIHCYGLLYHLQNPENALQFLSDHCSGILLIESCVSFGEEEEINAVREPSHDYSQSFFGYGCRPTRKWIWLRLKRMMPYVYATRTQPLHDEFPLDWSRGGNPSAELSRSIFVASRFCLDDNGQLLNQLPYRQSTI